MALRWSIKKIMGFKKNPDDYYMPIENKKGSKVFDIQPITKHLVYETMDKLNLVAHTAETV